MESVSMSQAAKARRLQWLLPILLLLLMVGLPFIGEDKMDFAFRWFKILMLILAGLMVFCVDLLFIRFYCGGEVWQLRQEKARTNWLMAGVVALFFSFLPADLIVAARVHSSFLTVGGTLAGIGFLFFWWIFRDKPSWRRGILAFGCLAVYLSSAFLIHRLAYQAGGH